MNLLITMADIEALESFSMNTNFEKKVRPHIIDAQEFDIRPIVGEELWLSMVTTPEDFPDILNPTIYTFNGHTYQHPGLKAVIVEYAYSRYKGDANSHDTAYGVQIKRNDYSDPVSEQTISRQMKLAKAQAEVYWSRVSMYLDRHRSIYPLWRYGCSDGSRPTGNGTTIRKVSRK